MTASKARRNEPFELGGKIVPAGERARFDLPAALLPTHSQLHLPFTVMNGLREGPRLWVSAAVHGDELNGVEIIRQVIERLVDPLQRGTLIAVPIVNVFGFIGQSRYFPDRRDLNRSFPGSARGSLAGRIAHLFMTEVVARCTHGIDLHTASLEKINYPQIRCDLGDPETRRLAKAFAAPMMIQSRIRDGSLRAAASKHGIPTLVYEAGEAQRFNELAIRVGVEGVLSAMAGLGMISRRYIVRRRQPLIFNETKWIRARRGGLLRLSVKEGQRVAAGESVGTISDPFGGDPVELRAPFDGLVVGLTLNPVVHGGDAVVNLGRA